jgi:hypothetical protein
VVLYLAREYKSAGVVSRIATTRKKVEGIKRCSLLFDRERRRFLFAKRAFSRFDVLAFVVLLRLFSLSLFAIFFFHCALSSNPSRVVRSRRTQKKESSSKTKKKRKKKARQSQTNNKKKRGRERRKRESDCLVFVFIRIIHHREALSLWRLESRLRSLASDTTLESASSSRNAFRGEREREFARFSRRENVRFFFLGNFKRLRETAFEI